MCRGMSGCAVLPCTAAWALSVHTHNSGGFTTQLLWSASPAPEENKGTLQPGVPWCSLISACKALWLPLHNHKHFPSTGLNIARPKPNILPQNLHTPWLLQCFSMALVVFSTRLTQQSALCPPWLALLWECLPWRTITVGAQGGQEGTQGAHPGALGWAGNGAAGEVFERPQRAGRACQCPSAHSLSSSTPTVPRAASCAQQTLPPRLSPS